MSLLVLLYHKVVEAPGRAAADPQRLSVAETTFRQQLAILAAEAEIIPLSQALRRGQDLARSGARYVAITFDDGYRATLDRAASALREAGVSATAFVSPGHAGRPSPYWWDRLAALRAAGADCGPSRPGGLERWLRSLDYAAASVWVDSLLPNRPPFDDETDDDDAVPAGWDHLRRLDRSAFDVGCHALHHDCLAALPLARVRQELTQAARAFRQEDVGAIPVLAYPYGSRGCVTADQVRMAVAPNFEWALSSVRGRLFDAGSADQYFLPRVYAEEWAADRFRSELRRAFDAGSRLRTSAERHASIASLVPESS